MKDLFNQALEAGETYAHASGTAREAKYRFLGLTYLVYREGLQHPQEFQDLLTSRLNYKPTTPEIKRPFLRLLHALMTGESAVGEEKHSYRTTKLVSALEQIHDNFEHSASVTVDAVVTFIDDSGGVGRLYDLSRAAQLDTASSAVNNSLEDHSPEIEADDAPQPTTPVEKDPKASARQPTKPAKAPKSQAAAGTNPSAGQDDPKSQDRQDAPIKIEIAKLGAWAIKDREGTRLKVPAFGPGKHIIHMEVGQDGFVEDWEEHIVSEDTDAVQLQPPVCPIGSGEASARH